MTEQQFRSRLRDLGESIVAHANDPDHDLETAMEQARQCIALMQSEWRHIARHQPEPEAAKA